MTIAPEAAKRLWKEVQENHARIDACTGHVFTDLTPEKKLGKRWKCSACGGECDTVGKLWYEQGLRHGKGKAT